MRFLVTGGAGFIGSNFVRMLLSEKLSNRPTKVIVLDALTYAGNLENLSEISNDERFEFVQGDIRSHRLVTDLFGEVDVVVNFAAESHVDRSIDSSAAFIETNVSGTNSLLQTAVHFPEIRFVHIGTDEVYGSINEGSWTEESPLLPNSPYAASKAAAELLVRAYSNTHKVNVSSTRCSNNYGPFQYPEKLIPFFTTNLLNGQKVPLYGDGLNRRDWLHVNDHCRAIDLVISQGKAGESYNIGGGVEKSNIEITELILEYLGFSNEMIERVADRKGHDFRYSVNDSKIRELGYEPLESFESGIYSTIEWYRANKDWWGPLKSGAGK